MKKIDNKIFYHGTGIHKVNNVTERYFYDWLVSDQYFWVHVLYLSAYEICNVYTNKGTPVEAYRKLQGAEATYQVLLDQTNTIQFHSHRQEIIKQIIYNDFFNCHGYTFLEGQFWLELNNEKLQSILHQDGYIECTRTEIREHGVCAFFNANGHLIHTGRVVNGIILSKFGINHNLIETEEEVYNQYDTLGIDRYKTKFYNKPS